MATQLVTRSEFARECSVSPAAVTKWCKHEGAAACVGKRIDRGHPAAKKYAAEHGVKPTAHAKPQRSASPTPTVPTPPKGGRKRIDAMPTPDAARVIDDQPIAPQDVSEEDVLRYEHLPLRTLKQIFGTAVAFRDWLDALKKIVDIKEKQLKNAETEGRLIGRQFVATHVFGAIEASNRRLLGDAPKTIARRLYAMARGGSSLEEGEKVVREIISAQLRTVKSTAIRVLRETAAAAPPDDDVAA